jgi:hypothetical protein
MNVHVRIETTTGDQGMSFLNFHQLAAARGDGLHPTLRALFERSAKDEADGISVRADGTLQAGPRPVAEINTPSALVNKNGIRIIR